MYDLEKSRLSRSGQSSHGWKIIRPPTHTCSAKNLFAPERVGGREWSEHTPRLLELPVPAGAVLSLFLFPYSLPVLPGSFSSSSILEPHGFISQNKPTKRSLSFRQPHGPRLPPVFGFQSSALYLPLGVGCPCAAACGAQEDRESASASSLPGPPVSRSVAASLPFSLVLAFALGCVPGTSSGRSLFLLLEARSSCRVPRVPGLGTSRNTALQRGCLGSCTCLVSGCTGPRGCV